MFRRSVCIGFSGTKTSNPIVEQLFVLVKRNNATAAVSQSVEDDWDNARPYEEMPGPKPLPIVGNIWRFFPFIGDLPQDFSQFPHHAHKEFGNISKITGMPGRRDLVILLEPSQIEKVFRNEGQWPIRDGTPSLRYYREVTRKDFYQDTGGLIVNQGEEWQKFRSKINPIMMQPRSTKVYIRPIDEVSSDFIKRIRSLREEKQEMPADFQNEMYKWALESVVAIALDTRLGCFDENLEPDSEPMRMIEAVQTIFLCMFKLDAKPSLWRYISTPAWKNLVRTNDYFNEIAMKYINQATKRLMNRPSGSDKELTILEKILARDPNPKTAIVMALDMFLAGIDTTSHTTAIAFYFLAKNPDKQQKLFEEIHRYLPDKNQPIASDILQNLKYLKCCIKESMRLRPIVLGNIRTLQKDMVLSNYKVPKGTDIFMTNFYLCQREEYFPQADKYIPERWMKSETGEQPKTKMTHPFVFMPFGFGPRMCAGRRFADLEMEILITKIVRNFEIQYNYGEMKFETGLLHTPSSPLKFRFSERE